MSTERSWLMVFALCSAGGGVAALASAIDGFRWTRRFLKTALATRGEVVAHEWRRGSKGRGKVYASVVEYRTATGERHRYTSSIWSGYRAPIGRGVSVLYDPEQPAEGHTNNMLLIWGAPALRLVLGVVFLVMAAALFRNLAL
jgi:hypothetical protein